MMNIESFQESLVSYITKVYKGLIYSHTIKRN